MKRVHFIGGPAHGDDRMIDERLSVYRVPEMPRGPCRPQFHYEQYKDYAYTVHEYVIRQVAHNTFIALHSSLA